LDEPLSALDARLRDQLRQEIDALLRRLGITAVYVTHDQAEAMALGDRICAMDGGRIAQIGSARDLYHRPASDFVAGFVGDTNRIATRAGTLLVRPEELVLRPCADGPFTVLRTTFLGPVVRVVLQHEGGQELRADVPDQELLLPGTRLSLGIRKPGVAEVTPLVPPGAEILPSD
jgi:putative spermidine/putrescine transport system ATP-binding protein